MHRDGNGAGFAKPALAPVPPLQNPPPYPSWAGFAFSEPVPAPLATWFQYLVYFPLFKQGLNNDKSKKKKKKRVAINHITFDNIWLKVKDNLINNHVVLEDTLIIPKGFEVLVIPLFVCFKWGPWFKVQL